MLLALHRAGTTEYGGKQRHNHSRTTGTRGGRPRNRTLVAPRASGSRLVVRPGAIPHMEPAAQCPVSSACESTAHSDRCLAPSSKRSCGPFPSWRGPLLPQPFTIKQNEADMPTPTASPEEVAAAIDDLHELAAEASDLARKAEARHLKRTAKATHKLAVHLRAAEARLNASTNYLRPAQAYIAVAHDALDTTRTAIQGDTP